MTVRELIDILSNEDPDRVVILQRDSEGNGYSPLSDVWAGAYIADSTWSGDVKMETLTEKDIQAGFSEEDVAPPDAARCVVLCPVN